MSSAVDFLQSNHVLALLIAILIFLTTILLVVKRWIGFSITLLLLLFSLAAGLLINNQQDFQHYFSGISSKNQEEISAENFHKQMLQAVEDLKSEVSVEKEHLRHVMEQVQDIFDSMDMQKQKLQNFIEEVRQRFKNEYPTTGKSDMNDQEQET